MAVIHGSSHKALKYFREESAALAVFWIYCSRVNNEGVAWPSIRGLKAGTGWDEKTCHKARKWLVENQALELVTDYVRPEWRNLEPQKKMRLKNLDKAEYYRVTGFIVKQNRTYNILYIPAQNPAPELEFTDVGSDTTSNDDLRCGNPSHVGQNPTELNTSSSQLDSKSLGEPPKNGSHKTTGGKKYPLDSKNKTPKANKPKNPTIPAAQMNPMKDAIAAAFGWKEPTSDEWGRIQKAAKVLIEAGVTPAQVPELHKWCEAQNWETFGPNALSGNVSHWRKSKTTGVQSGTYTQAKFD